jgi:hypothetical protein
VRSQAAVAYVRVKIRVRARVRIGVGLGLGLGSGLGLKIRLRLGLKKQTQLDLPGGECGGKAFPRLSMPDRGGADEVWSTADAPVGSTLCIFTNK